MEISQTFVAFSEYMNFNPRHCTRIKLRPSSLRKTVLSYDTQPESRCDWNPTRLIIQEWHCNRDIHSRLTSWHTGFQATAHWSCLDIYISQNIRLCKGDFEGQFQTSLQARIMIFFTWKFISIIPIFLLFFAGVVKSTAFCTQLLLFQKGQNVWVTFLHQIAT